jgi:hypothetical protein
MKNRYANTHRIGGRNLGGVFEVMRRCDMPLKDRPNRVYWTRECVSMLVIMPTECTEFSNIGGKWPRSMIDPQSIHVVIHLTWQTRMGTCIGYGKYKMVAQVLTNLRGIDYQTSVHRYAFLWAYTALHENRGGL